ncbi:MAG: 1,3-beta-galactosyl-N-acetylhexosamine phosphorylase [Lachnospiraceae bacterium]
MKKGRFTLPGEAGMEKEIAELTEKWGVDAIRDSDGTKLSEELTQMGLKVYSTLCLIREDNEWAKAHPQYRQQIYLMTEAKTAFGEALEIDLMEHYFKEQFAPNEDVDIMKYWQVTDRTLNVPVQSWEYRSGIVYLSEAKPFHQYTVTFLAYQLWEPVSMYNHLTNHWTEEHRLPLDIRYPEAASHTLEVLKRWLEKHPKTDVVRFTTFFYNFDLMYNELGKEKQVNWFGYSSCVSPLALQQFEEEFGYSLTPEDFADMGCYHTPFKNPSKRYLDWMDFNQRFVAGFAKQCVELVHNAGKKAIMFLGDHWAGTEPYGPYFPSIGLDAVVGAAGDGVTTRMIADIPIRETEARFYPYFFPDIFCEGGNPVKESEEVWVKCRRALLQKPMDRMGYGGYLSLAYQSPGFVEHVTDIAAQFRSIHEEAAGTMRYTAPFRVGILNAWGRIRTWQTHQVAHSLWNQRCYSYLGAMEALAGFSMEVTFLSFEDIKREGIPKDMKALFNMGDAGTSWSGGDYWEDEAILSAVCKWVYEGGGLIGIGEPSAASKPGSFFQLEDVFGVQKEVGMTASINKKPLKRAGSVHFITEGIAESVNYGEGMNMVYAKGEQVQVLDSQNNSCCLAVNEYGKGRAVYIAGLPYTNENARLLYRAIYWAAGKEDEAGRWFSLNPNTECTAFPKVHKLCLINNSRESQQTAVTYGDGTKTEYLLAPLEMRWVAV